MVCRLAGAVEVASAVFAAVMNRDCTDSITGADAGPHATMARWSSTRTGSQPATAASWQAARLAEAMCMAGRAGTISGQRHTRRSRRARASSGDPSITTTRRGAVQPTWP